MGSRATSERVSAHGDRAFQQLREHSDASNELGNQRTLLCEWAEQLEADAVIGDSVPVNAREGKLRRELG